MAGKRSASMDPVIAGIMGMVSRQEPAPADGAQPAAERQAAPADAVETGAGAREATPPPRAAHGAFTGMAWGGFIIGDLIGSGGMGDVYRARQPGLARVVALKVMPEASSRDPLLRQRFAAEARAAARLRDPHVVGIFDAGESDGRLWLAMEYIDGRNLDIVIRERRLAGGGFTPLEAAGIALGAARGLAAAHRERLVHRDVKPANLLVDTDGTVKVTDFGLVRILDEQGLTCAGTVLGTPLYLSPEQGRGLPAEAPADVYGLGAVLYELLTLQPPFSGATAEDLVARHNFSEPALPTELNPDIPADLQAICLTCLQKDPRRRYPDAAALADDLDRVRVGLAPLSAVFAPGELGTGASEAIRRLAGRRRQRLTAAALAACLAAMGLGWWWWDARKTEVATVRDRLRPLAAVVPVPATAGSDISRLSALSGDADPQVVQARSKLARLEELAAALEAAPTGPDARAMIDAVADLVGPEGDPRLARWRAALAAEESGRTATLRRLLDEPEPGPGLRHEAAAALAWLEARRSVSDWLARQVRSRLEAASAELAALSGKLAALNAPRPLPEGCAEALGRYERLAGFDDPDATRWRTRFDAIRSLAAGLAALDRREPPPAGAADQLARLAGLVGSDDLQVVAWSERLGAIAALRSRLSDGLDQVRRPPPGCAADLDRLAALIGTDSPEIGRWRDRLAAIARLSDGLAGLDGLATLPAEALRAANADVQALRALIGDDDLVGGAERRLAELAGPGRPAWATAAGHDHHGAWAEFTLGRAVQRLRWMPPHACAIGSAVGEDGHEDDEAPATVRFRHGLWVAESECAQDLWAEVAGTWPARPRDPALPVNQISRTDCEAFCRHLSSRLQGATARLPTEAEWEAAVRGGAGGPWAGMDAAHAAAAVIHAGSGTAAPQPAGSGPPNRLGLRDGPGNLREWCLGGYAPPLTGMVEDPHPANGDPGVVRGGSWADALVKCRPANRAPLAADARSTALGFRLVVEP